MAAITKHKLTRTIRLWSPVFLCAVFIFCFSSIKGKDVPPLFPYADVFFHFTVYAALAFFICRAVDKTVTSIYNSKTFFLCICLSSFYGASDEFHQIFVPGRSASFIDLLTDSIASIAGAILYL